jgi:nitroimidazol reductase NimA-like FMN-containing flavoprotein (pyridoxamine 5'-phosphate oxidase superfamily)
MQRKEQEVTENEEILNIMKKCEVCTVAFFDENYPYNVPLNFGVQLVENQYTLYFHGANRGKKLELRKKNNHVSFEMHCSTKLIASEKACDFTMNYESVCGNGILEVVNNEEKVSALKVLMKQYDSKKEYEFDENMVNSIAVLKLKVNAITGKQLNN